MSLNRRLARLEAIAPPPVPTVPERVAHVLKILRNGFSRAPDREVRAKLLALLQQIKAAAPQEALEFLRDRLLPALREAQEQKKMNP